MEYQQSDWGKTSARAITYGPRAFGWTDVQPTWALFNEYHDELTTSGAVDPRLDATMFYNKPGGMKFTDKILLHYMLQILEI